MHDANLTELVHAASSGDRVAWERLTERFAGLVWAVARAHRLSAVDAADVSQTTWLRFVEHLGRIRDPESVGAWLATTARNESLRLLRQASRQIATDHEALDLGSSDASAVELALLESERDAALWRAFESLSERCKRLLRVLMADPPPNYEEAGAALEMPVGSIGPTRGRCLDQLRQRVEGAGIS